MKNITLLIILLIYGFSGFSQPPTSKNLLALKHTDKAEANKEYTSTVMQEDECGQETLGNNFETSLGSLKNYIIANDFVVDEEMGVFSLNSITFHAFVEEGGSIDEVEYTFYEDDEGPGNEITSLTAVTPSSTEVIGQYDVDGETGDVIEVIYNLEDPITFEAEGEETLYWMGVQVPDYSGESIAFELITELETPTGTYAYLAGSWHAVEDLFGVERDGVMTLSGTCASSEACDVVEAGQLTGPETVCVGEEFQIVPEGATSGQSGISYMWESSPLDDDDWTTLENATSLNLTLEEGITEPTQFRFTISCDLGSSKTSAPISVELNPAEDCYCTPSYTMGCEDGDVINFVQVKDESGAVVFENESDCSESGYADYSQELEAIELQQGATYTMRISSESELPEEEDLRIWLDFDQNGVFDEEEEIGSTQGEGMETTGNFSFDFTIPEELALGTYRIRVRMAWLGGEDLQACENRSYGETEDYAIEVVENLEVSSSNFQFFELYPNPTADRITLEAQTDIQGITFFNMIGQQVKHWTPNLTETSIEVGELPAGVYWVKVKLEGQEKTFKVIKK